METTTSTTSLVLFPMFDSDLEHVSRSFSSLVYFLFLFITGGAALNAFALGGGSSAPLIAVKFLLSTQPTCSTNKLIHCIYFSAVFKILSSVSAQVLSVGSLQVVPTFWVEALCMSAAYALHVFLECSSPLK